MTNIVKKVTLKSLTKLANKVNSEIEATTRLMQYSPERDGSTTLKYVIDNGKEWLAISVFWNDIGEHGIMYFIDINGTTVDENGKEEDINWEAEVTIGQCGIADAYTGEAWASWMDASWYLLSHDDQYKGESLVPTAELALKAFIRYKLDETSKNLSTILKAA